VLIVSALAMVAPVVSALCRPSDDVLKVNGIPFRIWIAQHPDFQIEDSLAGVGTNAIPHLIRIIREPAASTGVYQARTWIWKHLPQAFRARFYRPGIQSLVTNRDLTTRMLAASASARIQSKPELAVPVLLEGLEKPLSGTTKTYINVYIQQPLGRFATAGPEAAAISLQDAAKAF